MMHGEVAGGTEPPVRPIDDVTIGTGIGDADTGSAGLARRIAAFAADQIVVAAYLAGLFGFAVLLGKAGLGSVLAAAFGTPLRGQLLGLFLLTLPVAFYFALWEGSPLRATPGKRLFGLRVLSVDGRPLPVENAMVRALVKFLPWEIAHTCLWRIPGWPGPVDALPMAVTMGFVVVWLLVAVYLVTARFAPRGRTPYDRLAGSVVVRSPRGAGSTVARRSGSRRRP